MRATVVDRDADTGAVAWKLSQLRLVAAVAIDAFPQVVRQLRSKQPEAGKHRVDRSPGRNDVSVDPPGSDRNVA